MNTPTFCPIYSTLTCRIMFCLDFCRRDRLTSSNDYISTITNFQDSFLTLSDRLAEHHLCVKVCIDDFGYEYILVFPDAIDSERSLALPTIVEAVPDHTWIFAEVEIDLEDVSENDENHEDA